MGFDDARLIVSVEHADGVAGVYDVPGEGLWMTADTKHGPGTGLDRFRVGREGLEGDRTALAGRLPPGAVAARARNCVGEWRDAAVDEGAWVVVIEDEMFATPMVKFLDSDGSIVPVPVPGDWERAPVSGTAELCPVCDACDWETISGTYVYDFGDGDTEEGEVAEVNCRRCGFRLSTGGWVFFGEIDEIDETVDPIKARRAIEDWSENNFKDELATILRSDLAVYGPRDRPCAILGLSSSGLPSDGSNFPDEQPFEQLTVSGTADYRAKQRERITLTAVKVGSQATPGVVVESANAPDEDELAATSEARARGKLREHIENNVSVAWPEGEAEATLFLERRSREAIASSFAAELTEVTIPVDGEPVEWLAVADGERWIALRLEGETQLTVYGLGTGVDGVEVELLTDLASSLEAAPFPDLN